MLHLLDPEKPGYGALLNKSTSDWLKGNAANQWIEEAHNTVWLLGAKELEDNGAAASKNVFDLYTQHRAEVFLDEERLEACLGADVLAGTCLGLSVDWSRTKSVIWTPQLRISNYWPHDSSLAPDPPWQVSSPPHLDAQDASDILVDQFWFDLETKFRELRYHFDLGAAGLELETQSFNSPVFCYARPTPMSEDVEAFLSSEHLPDLETLAAKLIVADGLGSTDVTGALLLEDVIALRRELATGENFRAYYLLLPWLPDGESSSDEEVEEVESDTSYIADKLSYAEFSAASSAFQEVPNLMMRQTLVPWWAATQKQAASLAQDLQLEVAFGARGSRRKKLFDLVWQFQATLSRLEAKSQTEVPELEQRGKRLDADIAMAAAFAREALPSAPLVGIGPLFERLTSGGTLVYMKLLDPIKEQAQQLRRSMKTARDIAQELQNTVNQQQREEQEREEENARVLGYGVAALAATAAFPILIGQLNWDALRKEMHQWTEWSLPFQWVGNIVANILQVIHPILVFAAIVAAGALIVILFGFLLRVLQRRFLPADWWRRGEVSDVGRKVEEIKLLLNAATPKINQLGQLLLASRYGQSGADLRAAKVRRDIDKLDKEACKRLVKVWEWLIKKYSRATQLGYSANTKHHNEALRARTEGFVISTELVDNRPVPYRLPGALCLYRYMWDSVGKPEFQRVLRTYGFNDDEIKEIDTLVKQYKGLSPRKFVSELRKAGVSALRDKPLEISTNKALHSENGTK